jgi:hypothetical protein
MYGKLGVLLMETPMGIGRSNRSVGGAATEGAAEGLFASRFSAENVETGPIISNEASSKPGQSLRIAIFFFILLVFMSLRKGRRFQRDPLPPHFQRHLKIIIPFCPLG